MNLPEDVRILYVEDEQEAREQTERMLRRYFDVVFAASNGKEGLELFQKEAFDLVLTDIRMPEMDGVEMIQHIRQINPTQAVIVISAYDFSDKLRPFLEREVEYFLPKPFETDNLLKIIADVRREQEAQNPESGVLSDAETIEALRHRVAELEHDVQMMEQTLRKQGIDY